MTAGLRATPAPQHPPGAEHAAEQPLPRGPSASPVLAKHLVLCIHTQAGAL